MIFACNSYADRSVSIAASDGKLVLVNSSPVTVTYTAECYDKVTGTNILSSASNATLQSKKDITYESAGTCANGQTPVYKSAQNVVACSGVNTQYSGAAALCGTASVLCTYNELVSRGVSSLSGYPDNYWFSASADPFYTTTDNWSKNYSRATSGGGKIYQTITMTDGKGSSNTRCSNTAGSSGNGIGYCESSYPTVGHSGAVCCPTNNGFTSCKVTIHSQTPANGSLQSPQFKGGSSF